MSLLIASTGKNLDPWIQALKETDPGLEVTTLDQVTDKSAVTFALAWNHPKGVFREFPNLKCISSMGAGVDHLLKDQTLPDQVRVVRIIDPLLSQDLFEFALAVVMQRNRTMDQFRVNQSNKLWKKKRYTRISDTRIGVMGTGVIGNHVASGLHGLGFQVCGWGRTAASDNNTIYTRYVGNSQLDAFLKASEILICLLPLTPETRGILNRENLSRLPQGAYLINLGRGEHVVDQDLIEWLDAGHLSGASLDVFSPEPLPEAHPFWEHPKIRITPHIASLTDPKSVAPQIVENYRRAMNGRPLLNEVDRLKGY
jgi:glyoxylate/hydroxypyruvate reductase